MTLRSRILRIHVVILQVLEITIKIQQLLRFHICIPYQKIENIRFLSVYFL